jgi:signal transduction histidine kinase
MYDELRKVRDELEERVKLRTAELAGVNKRLQREIAEHEKLKMSLEKHTEKLVEANRLKDLFTDIMRHDLLNPVGVIRNIMEIMEDDEKLKGSSEIVVIKRNVRKLEEIISNAADYSKLESIDEVEKTELDLHEIIKNVIDDFGSYIEDQGILGTNIEFKTDGEHKISASTIIESVFANLLTNAIKYSPEGSDIKIAIGDNGDAWKVSFADQGNGIPDEHKEAIFERFTRRDKGEVRGTGLGLAIVKRIVEMHDGRVWVEDNPEGGSIFFVNLPKEGTKA